MKERTVTCSRGHTFKKSSTCPVCPKCWSGYYKKQKSGDFPDSLSAPALRALLNAKIDSVAKLSRLSEKQILELHGMGPASLPALRAALRKKGRAFKKEK